MEQRRSPRYKLELPLRIVQIGESKIDADFRTRDISSGGVSFHSPSAIEIGARVEYVITLSSGSPPVRIRCLGKVLRSVEKDGSPAPHEVAVTMERYQFVGPEEAATFAAAS